MMKKLVLVLIAIMLLTVGGTCFAQESAIIQNTAATVGKAFYGPSYMDSGSHTNGQTAFITSGTIFQDWAWGGVSVFGISNNYVNATGTERRTTVVYFPAAGVTPIGGPALLSGTSSTLIVQVFNSASDSSGAKGFAGATLYNLASDTKAKNWEVAIPFTGFSTMAADSRGVLGDFVTSGTPWIIAPVTVDWNEGTNGASIFGISGVTGADVAGGGGVSIWNRHSGNGALTSTTRFAVSSGVTFANGAPVISGNSLYVLVSSGSGVSIVMFDKQNLTLTNVGGNVLGAGVMRANVVPRGQITYNNQFYTPTPCISGGSIFVVDWTGGVSSFSAATLGLNKFWQFNTSVVCNGVTASPVTDGTYLVLSSGSGVTCIKNNNLSGTSIEWTYDFGAAARYQIWATPVISNNYVWVMVRDTTAGDTQIHRFYLPSAVKDGGRALVQSIANSYADPIIAGQYLWTVSYNPTVERVFQHGYAYGYDYWPQFKFDTAKTGANTKPYVPVAAVVSDDDSGCFISTLTK